jgi:hypothetical protein
VENKRGFKVIRNSVKHALLIGVQVTIGKTHGASDVEFYQTKYEAIKEWMHDVDELRLGFLWITENPYPGLDTPTQKPVGGVGLRANKDVEYTNYGITLGDASKELARQLEKWRKDVTSQEDDKLVGKEEQEDAEQWNR